MHQERELTRRTCRADLLAVCVHAVRDTGQSAEQVADHPFGHHTAAVNVRNVGVSWQGAERRAQAGDTAWRSRAKESPIGHLHRNPVHRERQTGIDGLVTRLNVRQDDRLARWVAPIHLVEPRGRAPHSRNKQFGNDESTHDYARSRRYTCSTVVCVRSGAEQALDPRSGRHAHAASKVLVAEQRQDRLRECRPCRGAEPGVPSRRPRRSRESHRRKSRRRVCRTHEPPPKRRANLLADDGRTTTSLAAIQSDASSRNPRNVTLPSMPKLASVLFHRSAISTLLHSVFANDQERCVAIETGHLLCHFQKVSGGPCVRLPDRRL